MSTKKYNNKNKSKKKSGIGFFPAFFIFLAFVMLIAPKILTLVNNQIKNEFIYSILPFLDKYHIYLSIFFILLGVYFYIKKFFKKKKLYHKVSDLESLRNLTWQEFESLTAEIMVGLKYRVKEMGGAHADGGIDLIAYKGKYKYIVQCKHYKSTTVGVKVVREMLGVCVHENAHSVYIFTCGKFTKDAIEFAKEKRIYLVNGEQVCSLVKKVKGK